MSNSLPPITPAQRQRLQKLWEEARAVMAHAGSPPSGKEAEIIHELLTECVIADPGNTVYLDAFLVNLRRLPPKPRFSIRNLFSRNGSEYQKFLKALSEKDPMKVISLGPGVLRDARHRSSEVLFAISDACQNLDLPQAEVRYLQESLHYMPGAFLSLLLFRSLMRQGRFVEARNTVQPYRDTGDVTHVNDLLAVLDGPVIPFTPQKDVLLRSEGGRNAADFLALAAEHIQNRQFDEAEAAAANALSLSGGNLVVREQVEDISLARLQNNVAIARRLVEHEPSEAHQRTLRRWEEELGRLELETLNARSERFPQDASLKLQVAVRLKQAGNYSGAVQRLEEIVASESLRPQVLLELGECWQHLRQFKKALDFYDQAIASAKAGQQQEPLQLALYRAAILATAMQRTADAKAWLEQLISLAPDYKDAQERLRLVV